MQTERVTFLTSREQKAALDAFAKRSGQSVGHILREASERYIARRRDEAELEAELDALTQELEVALPQMRESLASTERSIAKSRAALTEARDYFESKKR
jgi:hypothetical protein